MTLPAFWEIGTPATDSATVLKEIQFEGIESMPPALDRIQPLFICLGVPKAATTWIHRQLEAHPEVSATSSKEINYWSANYSRGPEWYISQFPKRGAPRVHAEVSVGYFGNKEALQRMAADLKNVRFMVSLRNPYERALSHYWMMVRSGFDGSLADALIANPRILYFSLYAQRMEVFLEVFPLEMLHVAMVDDLETNQRHYVQRLYDSIDVDSQFVPGELEVPVNPGRTKSTADVALFHIQRIAQRLGLKRGHLLRLGLWSPIEAVWGRLSVRFPRPEASDNDLEVLDLRLREDVLKLEEILGRSLSHWLPRACLP